MPIDFDIRKTKLLIFPATQPDEKAARWHWVRSFPGESFDSCMDRASACWESLPFPSKCALKRLLRSIRVSSRLHRALAARELCTDAGVPTRWGRFVYHFGVNKEAGEYWMGRPHPVIEKGRGLEEGGDENVF